MKRQRRDKNKWSGEYLSPTEGLKEGTYTGDNYLKEYWTKRKPPIVYGTAGKVEEHINWVKLSEEQRIIILSPSNKEKVEKWRATRIQ